MVKIRALTASSFEVHLDMLLLVLQSLEAAGLQRHPAWELHRGVRSVSITPTLVARRLRYSVEALGDWTADRALLAHPEPLELAGAQACADRLVAAGFQARQLWWFSGSRVSVRLWAAALGKTDSYYLVLKGAGRGRIIDLLNALGVDWQRNDPNASAKPPARPPAQAQILATLEEADPPIWRRFVIPTTATLWALHCALTDLFGWNDSHLHEFRVPLVVERDGQAFLAEIPWGIPDGESPCLPTWSASLDDLLALGSPALAPPAAPWRGAPVPARRPLRYT
ncbi:MAG TPA: hypothetical protein VFS21_14300 [Roseiflexaceae bacterium]|nr:hypothetical protein [Roseiflexaceae bacterium]